MPALNFIKRFAPDVESGKKRSTIRRAGKRLPPKIGESLSLFTGMRTKSCRLLRKEICTDVTPLMIHIKKGKPELGLGVILGTEKCWVKVVPSEVKRLANDDGFASVDEFFAYFLGDDKEFYGFLIEWVPTV